MAKDVSIKLELNSINKILMRRGLQNNGPAQKMAASELKRMCEPYVPMLSGILKNTAQIQDDGVLYNQPHAAVQYYSNSGNGCGGYSQGGQRGKEWDKRMMADHSNEYVDAVAKNIGGKRK